MVLFLRKSIKVGQILHIILVETKEKSYLKRCGKVNLYYILLLLISHHCRYDYVPFILTGVLSVKLDPDNLSVITF